VKTCKVCKSEFSPRKPLQSVCNLSCAIKQSRAKTDKAREKVARKALDELNRRSIPWQHKQTKTVFNKMRVLEELKWFKDRGLPPTCISCGKENMDWCCGHYQSVGSSSEKRYDRLNTYLQCNRYCNMGLSGNISGNKTTRGYEQGLIDRFGEDDARDIMEYCTSSKKSVKWDWQEIQLMRGEFAKRVRELA
jgi:hypothetical protein